LLRVGRYWLSVIRIWLLVTGSWLLVNGFRNAGMLGSWEAWMLAISDVIAILSFPAL
jgi:hypothetical protein